MIDVEDMRCFVAVLESGGFARAATRLGISKSMVSRRIAKMEENLRTSLITRSTRGISPTDAGLEFKARSERIIADFDEACAAVAEHSGEVIGRLRVSAPRAFGIRHIAPVLADLARHHPRLEIDVSFSDRIVDLIGEQFDVAIRIGALRDSSLIARHVAPVHSVLVASPDYLARRGRPHVPADLLAHDFLIYSGSTEADIKLRVGKRWHSLRPTGNLRSDSGEAITQWAIAGLGIAELPSFMIEDAIEDGLLEPLLRDYPTREYGIFLVRPPGSNVPAKVRALIDLLVERLGRRSVSARKPAG